MIIAKNYLNVFPYDRWSAKVHVVICVCVCVLFVCVLCVCVSECEI